MTLHPTALRIAALCLAAAPAGPGLHAAPPDLSGTVPILSETFAGPLSRHDGTAGLWSTMPWRRQIVVNGDEGGFWDDGVLPPEAEALIPPTIEITDDGLVLRTVAVPEAARPALDAYLVARRQGHKAGRIRYLSGMINTHQTWAQRYGYVEVTARLPRGRGRWPAVWLSSAGPDWPPELDIFEAYGAGLDQPADKDHRFNVAVHFDTESRPGTPPLPLPTANPFAPGAPPPNALDSGFGGHWAFQHTIDARTLGADIYDGFHTWAALWTPETVSFYFGTGPDSLREIFRTPTPADLKAPMILIAQDHFTAEGGWWAADPATVDRVLDPANALTIRSLKMRALLPQVTVGPGDPDPGDSVLLGTPGDDTLRPGAGFDVIRTGGGADTIEIARGLLPKIVEGFGADDTLRLVGFPFRDTAAATARLTAVGADTWLTAGADPYDPQTVVFRGVPPDTVRAARIEVAWPRGRHDWGHDAARDGHHVRAEADGQELRARDYGTQLSDAGHAARLVGGPGDDRFHLANAATEVVAGQGGVDTAIAYVSRAVPAGVAHAVAEGTGLVLTGTPAAERLEARGTGLTLAGGGGGDLYDLAGAEAATVRLARHAGHDRIEGLEQDDRIAPDAGLLAARAGWTIARDGQDIVVDVAPEQSLRIADTDPITALIALPALGGAVLEAWR